MAQSGVMQELQRRNVPRAAILYVTTVWALSQGIAQLAPVVGAPDWAPRWFLIAAVIGFPFWIAFSWFYELTPSGLKRDNEIAVDAPSRRASSRTLDMLIIAALSIAVVLLLTDRFLNDRGQAVPAIPEKSIAVLPLVNESGDPNALYFSDGLSESFITALSQISGLKVIGRASSFRFRNSKDSVERIAATLGVAHLLEGSVQRAGDAVRISAELVNAKDGSTLWSQRYDRPYKDLFKLQDEITNAVASALKMKLLGNNAPSQSDRPLSGNLSAYNAYLEGTFYLRHDAKDDRLKAIDAYAKAVKIDPNYGAAWAALGLAWSSYAGANLAGQEQLRAYARGRQATARALAIAPHLALAHAARGLELQLQDLDWMGAEKEFRRATELAPMDPGPKLQLSLMLATTGRLTEAVKAIDQALELDPLRPIAYRTLSTYLGALGRLDEAEKAIRKAISLQPGAESFYCQLTIIDIQRHHAKAAMEDARKGPPGFWQDMAVTLAAQIGGNRKAADAAVEKLIAKYQGADYQVAEVYGARGDANKTFAWLERARVMPDPGIFQLSYDPLVLRYRHDPRFAKLCRELKLPVPKD